MKFVNASGVPANFVAPGELFVLGPAEPVIQEEPPQGRTPPRWACSPPSALSRASPSTPTERMKKILTDAANIGAVTARSIAFKIAQRRRTSIRTVRGDAILRRLQVRGVAGVSNLDGAAFYYYFATGVTLRWRRSMVAGVASTPGRCRCQGQSLRWRQDLQAAPAANVRSMGFLSVIVYDNQTRSMVQATRRPERQQQNKGVRRMRTVRWMFYFDPSTNGNWRNNWVQTIPGKAGSDLRLYGPLEPWFQQDVAPGEIELQP